MIVLSGVRADKSLAGREGNMMTSVFILSVVLGLVSPPLEAQMTLGGDSKISFASVAEGKQILTRRDAFVERMSPFDRAARMKTDRDVSEAEYLEFVGQNVFEWTDAEKEKIDTALAGIQESLEAMALPFPEEVLLIKTTGKEEGGAAYTRTNAIVLPEANLNAPADRIQKIICHELFHVLSRANPDLKERLYAAIGFEKCNEVEFPQGLESRKITNPDAPINDHCISIQVGGEQQWAVPILFSRAQNYDAKRGGEFFSYLEFKLLLVERRADGTAVPLTADGQQPKLVGLQEVSGFFEEVGRNTGYIIHPEEILADNFVLLVLEKRDVPSPEVLEKIETILPEDHINE
jgi:hypothetical protein